MGFLTDKDSIRFWSHVKLNPITNCLEWQLVRSLVTGGYGKFKIKGKFFRAHRIAWMEINGEIPNGLQIDHIICYNPRCVNVDHLRLATSTENQHGRRDLKLNEEKVSEIRKKYISGLFSQKILGKEFGVGQDHISRIVNNSLWRKA